MAQASAQGSRSSGSADKQWGLWLQVLGRMKQLMVDNNTAASHSFLLDDDSSIPFSLDDIAALMEDKVRAARSSACASA